MGKCTSGQMSLWTNVAWANVTMGKRRMGKGIWENGTFTCTFKCTSW
jgi:hypothetical protein